MSKFIRYIVVTLNIILFSSMIAPSYLQATNVSDVPKNISRSSSDRDFQNKIDKLQEEFDKAKIDLHQGSIDAFNRSSDAANRLIAWVGVVATAYGIIIALASLFVGYVSIRNKQRSDAALTTLEGAKAYVDNKIAEFEDTAKIKTAEMTKKLNDVIQMSLEQLAQDTAEAAKKVKQFGEQGISVEATQKIELLERKIKIFEDIGLPEDPKVLYSKAMVYREKKELDTALDLLKRAVTHDDKYIDAHFQIGYIQHQLDHYTEAIAAYDKVISIQPKSAVAWNNRGVSLFKLKRIPDALDSYNKAIEADPNYVLAYKNKIGIMSENEINNNNIGEFINCVETLIKIEPDVTEQLLHAGRLLTKLGNVEGGAKYYKIYLENYKKKIAEPNAGEADHLCYYEALIIDGDYTDAMSYNSVLDTTITSENRKVIYAILKSYLFFLQGDDGQAIQQIRDIVGMIRSSSYDKLPWNFVDINPYLKSKLDDEKYQRCVVLQKAARKEAPLESIKID